MKSGKVLVAALMFSVGSFTAMAQGWGGGAPSGGMDGGPGGQGGRRGGPMSQLTIETLKTELKLTDEQATKLTPLLAKVKAEFQNMFKNMRRPGQGGGPGGQSGNSSDSSSRQMGPPGGQSGPGGGMDQMRQKMEELQKKLLAIIAPAKDFLSADQYKKLTSKLTERPGGRGGPGGRRGGRRGGRSRRNAMTLNAVKLTSDLTYTNSSKAVTVVLENGAVLTGKIENASVEIDAKSKWVLTGDSNINGLTIKDGVDGISDAINSKGHNITYDSSLQTNSWLGSRSYQLPSGGLLAPR